MPSTFYFFALAASLFVGAVIGALLHWRATPRSLDFYRRTWVGRIFATEEGAGRFIRLSFNCFYAGQQPATICLTDSIVSLKTFVGGPTECLGTISDFRLSSETLEPGRPFGFDFLVPTTHALWDNLAMGDKIHLVLTGIWVMIQEGPNRYSVAFPTYAVIETEWESGPLKATEGQSATFSAETQKALTEIL